MAERPTVKLQVKATAVKVWKSTSREERAFIGVRGLSVYNQAKDFYLSHKNNPHMHIYGKTMSAQSMQTFLINPLN